MSSPLVVVVPVVMLLLVLSMLLAFVRLLRGPSLLDRVLALDLIGLAIIAMVATYSIHTEQPVLLRAATSLALVSFLATVSVALYVQRKGAL